MVDLGIDAFGVWHAVRDFLRVDNVIQLEEAPPPPQNDRLPLSRG